MTSAFHTCRAYLSSVLRCHCRLCQSTDRAHHCRTDTFKRCACLERLTHDGSFCRVSKLTCTSKAPLLMQTGVLSQIHHIAPGRCSAALLGKCHNALTSFLSFILNITETSQPLLQQKCQDSQDTLSPNILMIISPSATAFRINVHLHWKQQAASLPGCLHCCGYGE